MAYYISNIARSKGDPKILHSGPSSLGAADRMAKALGWFSIGLGLTELIAAERITRALGMEGKEALVRAYGRQDWDGVMDVFADDAQIESAAPEAAGPSGNAPRILNKHEFGQALEPIIASNVGYSAQNVQLRTVSPMQVQVSGTMTLLMAGRPSIHRDRLWVFEKRGEHWLVVRAQDL